MNGVRKHLSRVKGGRLAEAFRGTVLLSLIVSDVVGDPLDVIASGPTAADPTTFADALAVIERFGLRDRMPAAVVDHLERGGRGERPETPKVVPASVTNLVIASNALALKAAAALAEGIGYRVLNLGSFVEGETREVANAVAGIVRGIRADGTPVAPPACILFGGETTVTLGDRPGRGGRNQEFVLALLAKLGRDGLRTWRCSAAAPTARTAPPTPPGRWRTPRPGTGRQALGLSAADFLGRHDAYTFFDAVGGLVRTGLTQTNVMDVRVVLVW